MADGVQITAGTGTVIACDEVVGLDGTTREVQRVKLGIGREGEYADLTALPATEETAQLILIELKKLTLAFSILLGKDLADLADAL